MVSPYEDFGASKLNTAERHTKGRSFDIAESGMSSNVLEIPQTPEAARKQDAARVDQAGKLLSWAENNLGRFDLNGDRRVNLGEVNLGLRTSSNPEDRQMLSYLSDHFSDFKRNPNDGISVKDIQKNYERQQEIARNNEIARQQESLLKGQQKASRDLMTPLLRTSDGDPSGSLFRVLDTIRNHKPDDEISKRDLERYLSDYDRRVRTGDANSGQFTPENRQFVQNLRDNWDSPEVRRLRGTWVDSNNEEHANGSITARSLAQAGGLSGDLFGSFISPDAPARREAPTVTADMVDHVVGHTNVDKFRSTPRPQDDAARAADIQRVKSAGDLFSWGQNNLGRYDLNGDRALNYGEIDLGIRTTRQPVDAQKLTEMETNFGALNHHGKISNKDLRRNVDNQQAAYDTNESYRQQRVAIEGDQAASRDLMAPLLKTDNGHPNNSLFKVLDADTGHPNDKVGKRELKHYLEEYDWRSRHGDVGGGHYTPQNRAYVQFLYDNWNSPEVVRLRGTYTVRDDDRSGRTHEVPNGKITPESLRNAGGYQDVYDLYLSNKGS